MKLEELLKGIAIENGAVSRDVEISQVQYDSRAVQPGDLFAAIRGYATDGHKYIASAIQKGAAAVVCEEIPEGISPDTAIVLVKNSRIALAEIAANYFDHPAEHMTLIGVTGTNGKTTSTCLIKHILEQQGYKVGLIGTNQNLIGQQVVPTERTTPESYELHALFAQMHQAGCTHVVMEVSSHSLVLHRVHGLRFAVGAFTNLTQDHLDFHKTMEAYRKAKQILFTQCQKGVINIDDAAAPMILAQAQCPTLTFSASRDDAALSAKNIQYHADSVDFVCAMEGAIARVHLGIPGEFSVHNALTALGCAVSLEVSLSDAAHALASAPGVKGRAEVVPTGTEYTVLIDYAHSPDGVENILKAVRGFTTGRVIALFGCGGDRDKGKRPKMGKIAAELSDLCVVTSDNPRTEAPEAIIEDIVAGMRSSKTPRQVIVNRPEAICWALDQARAGDTVVLMGKGHEDYQEINHVKHHLDEREEIQKYFNKKQKKN